MTFARPSAYLAIACAVALSRVGAQEVNAWPFFVGDKGPTAAASSWSALGPFLFSTPSPVPDSGRASGFRPFFIDFEASDAERIDLLYPLFFYRNYADGSYKWSVFDLINGEGLPSKPQGSGEPIDRHFDVWPFYFSHETGNPVDSYHALFPLFGTIKYRVFYDRIFWAPFPLFVQTQQRGTRETYVPWPIIRFIDGRENGFALWPLFGSTHGPGPASHFYLLWPLIWDNTLEPKPDAPEGGAPPTQVGFLPFFTRETGPGYESENFVWPFFGYTDRTLPKRYREDRYLWPLFVQGRGDGKFVNRWGPFYTHSNVDGMDSTWILWPLWHRQTWTDADIAQTKSSFFYFLYASLEQRSVSRPSLAPAYKRHVWPFVSVWDNGAGSRQVQVLSPLEIFFPDNADVRQAWSPLFAVYRYSQRPTGETRTSILWDAVTWRRGPDGECDEFHAGPLVGMRRGPLGEDWSILGFDFGPKSGNPTLANR